MLSGDGTLSNSRPPHLKVTSPWADAVIGFAYFAIPVELAFFVVRLPSMNGFQQAVGVLFVCFILFCGIGHILDASAAPASYVLFDRYITAIVSALTAILSPKVFSYSVQTILGFLEERRVQAKQKDMLADAQAMTHLGNWEIRYGDDATGAAGEGEYTVGADDTTREDVPLNPVHRRQADGNAALPLRIEGSDEWFRIFGIPPGQGNQIPMDEYLGVLADEDVAPIQQKIHEALVEGIPYTITQKARRADDHREIYIRGFGKPLYAGDGRTIVGLRGTAQDITSEVAVHRELTEAKERALLESKHKDVFLATMSHELRTPLTSIIGHVELMEETALNELQQEYLGNAKRAATTLLSLISDILDFSKLAAGVADLEHAPVSVDDILKDIQAISKDLGRDVALVIQPYNGPIVMGDAVRLRQVLLNLVSNALKFTPAGGSVTVTVDWQREPGPPNLIRITFRVVDNGIGMSPTTVENLFQPFRQADASVSRRFGGTGLGLSIVKKLVDAMRGELTVISREGEGTTFTVRLTMEESSRPIEAAVTKGAATKEITAGESPQRPPLRILLAEDNPVTQKLVQRMLHEHKLDVADNGKIAVDLFMADPSYDVILCDVNMPIMDGLTATKEIRASPRGGDVYIIGLTANAFKEDRDKCLAAGMDSYLPKPFRKDALLSAVTSRNSYDGGPPL